MTAGSPSRAGRLGAVFGNLGWLLASNGLMAALSLVYIGIASRTLGIADFGRFALITGAAQTLATLVSFETWKLVVQYGLAHEARGDRAALWRVQKIAALIDGASGLLGLVLAILLFSLWPGRWGLDAAVQPYALGYVIVQMLTLRSAPAGILRLRDRFSLAAIGDSMTAVGRLVGAVLALAFWPTVPGFLCAWAASEILTAATYWWLVHKVGDLKPLLAARIGWRQARAENPRLLRVMWSTNVQATLGLATRQAPLLLVGSYAGPAAAGGFRLAVQLANALSKLSILLTRAAFPELVRSIQALSRERLAGLLTRILASSALGAGLVMLIVAGVGKPVLSLIGGRDFGAAYPLLLWLAGGACIEIAAASFEPMLLALHRPGIAILARGGAVLIQFAALLALLPALGAMGASLSVFLGSLLAALFLGTALFRAAGRRAT